jgi:putative redox protein
MASKKTATVVWKQGLDFNTVVGSGAEFSMGSSTFGASPMEMVLAAAAGCSAMDVISILAKKRQKVSGFSVAITGLRTEEYPMVFTEIDLLYVVSGENIDPTAVARAIELSQTKYCSVSIMLQRAGIIIRTDYRIESEAVPAS